MGRKVCRTCDGRRFIHEENCVIRYTFDAECDCEYPLCPECEGTGERNRHKKKEEAENDRAGEAE